jgi:hypothetical protein
MKSESEIASEGLLKRALGRFRLPLRPVSRLADEAARNRVVRLFEVNFKQACNR